MFFFSENALKFVWEFVFEITGNFKWKMYKIPNEFWPIFSRNASEEGGSGQGLFVFV